MSIKLRKIKNIFGDQTASSGERLLLIANVVVICINNIYEKAISMPNPRWKAIPPLTLFEETLSWLNLDKYASCSALWFLEFVGIIVDISQCKIPAISELREASLNISLSLI